MPASSPSPRFSVIVPTLNEVKLLGATLAQFERHLRDEHGVEVIVSDGGSTDGTLEVAHAAADSVVEHAGPTRQNIAQGRNAGAKIARGDVLIFVNADTRFAAPDGFFTAIGARMADPRCNAIAFPVTVFPEERRLGDILFHTVHNAYFHFLNVIGVGMGRGECHVVRRTSFERIRGYDAAFTAGEDFDLYRRLRRLGPIPFLGSCMVYESPRRYRKYGYPRVVWDWFRNAISVMFAKKSVSDVWEQVR